MTRRKFERPTGWRKPRILFIISAEGEKTEPQYFQRFNNEQVTVILTAHLGGKDNIPPQVLKRMEKELSRRDLRPGDEAWLVVDQDNWTNEQQQPLFDWVKKADNRGLARSAPCFEYWLLLHFEEGKNVSTTRQCTERLKKYLSGYTKGLPAGAFSADQTQQALARAKNRHTPPCTTVHILVDHLLQAQQRGAK